MYIVLILILTAIIRCISLNQSLWLDEAINVVYAHSSSFIWFVSKYPIGDFHPPLWFALLWLWGHLFGFSEVSVRLPSLLLGVLTVIFTYLIGKELFSKRVALIASLLLALAPLHIYYSQEARMYSLATFSVTLASYFLLRLNNKLIFNLGYIFSLLLVLGSDYVAYLIIPVHLLYLILFNYQQIKKWLVLLTISLLVFSPWLTILIPQLMSGQQTALLLPGWAKVVGSLTIESVLLLPVKILTGRVSLDNFNLYLLLVLFLGIPYLILFFQLTIRRLWNNLLVLWLIGPVILAILVSIIVPVFSYTRLLYILPAFYLLTALSIAKLSGWQFKAITTFIVASELILSLVYLTNPQFQREDWKTVQLFLSANTNQRNIILLENKEIFAPLIYYSAHPQIIVPALNQVPAKNGLDLINLNEALSQKQDIYLMEYLRDVTDPGRLVEKVLIETGYQEIAAYNFNGVGLIRKYHR